MGWVVGDDGDIARTAGPHQVIWDGTDESGADVARGICFIRLTGEAGESSQRVLVLS